MRWSLSACLWKRAFSTVARVSRDRKDFLGFFPEIVKDLTSGKDVPEANEWFGKVLEYNVTGGKFIRGLTVVSSSRYLKDLDDDSLRLSCILGWCVELLQAFFIVIDDVMDQSEMRRGRPAWHTRSDVGSSLAINDGLMLEASIYRLLKMHFQTHPEYVLIMELFHETTTNTIYGQSMDLMSTKCELEQFTMERYNAIVRHKTAFYTFYLPVASAMLFCGIRDSRTHSIAQQILFDMGKFFQVQDDYIDVFGDSSVTGKIGTDIVDRKCSWPTVIALERCSQSQFAIFKQNYGCSSPEKIKVIKELYLDLGIPTFYKAFEEESFNKMNKNIKLLGDSLPHQLFHDFLERIYKRTF